ncbi:protein of unknown function [Streptomyces sp. KY75]|nr:protein of unknown function [Streptomyces sp. KY70]CAD5977986.1 protein of unknown function [Streptomyces sp. KY75]
MPGWCRGEVCTESIAMRRGLREEPGKLPGNLMRGPVRVEPSRETYWLTSSVLLTQGMPHRGVGPSEGREQRNPAFHFRFAKSLRR